MFNGCMSTHVVYQDVDEEYERWGEGGDEAIDTKVLPGGGARGYGRDGTKNRLDELLALFAATKTMLMLPQRGKKVSFIGFRCCWWWW